MPVRFFQQILFILPHLPVCHAVFQHHWPPPSHSYTTEPDYDLLPSCNVSPPTTLLHTLGLLKVADMKDTDMNCDIPLFGNKCVYLLFRKCTKIYFIHVIYNRDKCLLTVQRSQTTALNLQNLHYNTYGINGSFRSLQLSCGHPSAF